MDDTMSLILVYITNRNESEAKKVAEHLLKKKLVACTVIFPVESMYWWKDEIEKTGEYVIISKSVEKNFERIKTEVKKIHSYKIPCIIKINVEANKEYKKWVRKNVR